MLKLAFSTLGCPDWRFSDIVSTAKDLRFDGFEVRGIANEICVPKIRAFDAEHIEKSMQKLKDSGLEIPMLTSGISVGTPYENAVGEAESYVDLAQKLGSQFIRIIISNNPQPEPVDWDMAVARYNEICRYAEGKNVIPLIETNGVLSDTKEMLRFIEAIESKNKGVLWDVHHPFRYFGEQPRETYRNIGRYVEYIHVKDSIMQEKTLCYRMMGYGDVPVYDSLKVLRENGYEGYVSLEWVKRWNPDLEEAGIVFAHFMSYMDFLLGRI